MSKTLNEMVHTIVDHYDSVNQAADAIGVHFATIDRLLNDEMATAQARTTAKIEALYEEITARKEPKEKITKLEIGKAYEIKVPDSLTGKVKTTLRGVVKKEYRQFYQLDDDGKSVIVLKADLINERTTVTPIDAPAEEIEKPVDVECVPVVDDEPTEEVTEEPTEPPTIEGENAAERLNYCLNVVYRCNKKIADGEKAKKDKAAILPLMDEIYKEFRG